MFLYWRQRAWWCFAACAILLAAAVPGLPKLSINSDARVFFSEEDPDRQRLDRFESDFAIGKNLAIALHVEEGTLFEPERLALIRQLTDRAWMLPHISRVESIANAPHVTSDTDEIIIADMIPRHDEGASDRVMTRVLDDDLLRNRLVSPDGKTTVVMLNALDTDWSREAASEVIEAADALVEELGLANAGLDVWYGGRVASDSAFGIAGKSDLAALLPVAILVMTILLVIILKSLTNALILVLVPASVSLMTLGVAGHFGIEITAMTANIPVMIVALGIAAFSHLVIGVQNRRRRGHSLEAAIEEALRQNVAPITLTYLTTSIGFLSLNAADSPPLRLLGNLVAFATVSSLVFGLALIPTLLWWFKPAVRAQYAVLPTLLARCATIVTGRPRLIAGLSAVLSVIIVAGTVRIEANDYFPHFFDDSYQYRRDADEIEKRLPAYNIVQFYVEPANGETLLDPQVVGEIAEFETFLASQPNVVHTASIAETLRRLHTHLDADAATASSLPQSAEALAQYILLYEMSLPVGLDLTNQITIDKKGTRISATMSEADSRDVRALKAAGEAWLADEGRELDGYATGMSALFSKLTIENVRSMIGGTLIALVLISAILILAFRSMSYGILSLLPNLLPSALAFGIWGYTVGVVGVASSVVGAVTLGIIVDDTIHLIWRYRRARREGLEKRAAIDHTFARVGEPMVVSTIVLVSGFALLLVSGFHVTESLGALSSLTIFAALVADLLLLSALLYLLDGWLERRPASASARTAGARVPAE